MKKHKIEKLLKNGNIIICLLFLTGYFITGFSYSFINQNFKLFFVLVSLIGVIVLIYWIVSQYITKQKIKETQEECEEQHSHGHFMRAQITSLKAEIDHLKKQPEIDPERVRLLEKDYQELQEVQEEQVWESVIALKREWKTGVSCVDRALNEKFGTKAVEEKINLDVLVMNDLSGMAAQFGIREILLGDLVENLVANALNAVRRSGRKDKSVRVLMGYISDDSYELNVYDNGLDFDPNILDNFGAKGMTTCEELGGSGYGIAQILDTLRLYDAGLRLEKQEPESGFTKCVSAVFGKGYFVDIEDYRKALLTK